MAHALSFTDGTTTITVSSGNYTLTDYVPRTPSGDALTVTESATVWMVAASKTALQTEIRAIENFFGQCQRRQATNTGAIGYVQLAVDGDGTTYRSEVLAGQILMGEDALRHWASLGVEVLITWTRRFYWEYSLTPIGISNTGTAKTTSGVTIYNHHDSTSHENFVDITGADIVGSLPAPIKFSMEALSAIAPSRYYLSGNTFYTPASLQAVYEGENQTSAELTHPAATVDANSSNGYYQRCSWTTSVSHTSNAFTWTISATQLDYADGGWFQVLLRLANDPPANCYVKVKVKFDATTPLTTLFEGPEILLRSSNELQDLGSVQLPPGYVTGSPTALALVLSIRNNATNQLDVDYIQLVGPDGVHRFDQQGYLLDVGDLVVDDGPNEGVYIQTYGGFTQHIFSDYSSPLMVWPGQNMRVRLMFDDVYGNSAIANTFKIFAYYRPRRLTL